MGQEREQAKMAKRRNKEKVEGGKYRIVKEGERGKMEEEKKMKKKMKGE